MLTGTNFLFLCQKAVGESANMVGSGLMRPKLFGKKHYNWPNAVENMNHTVMHGDGSIM